MSVTVEQFAGQVRGWAIFNKEMRRHWGQEPVDPNVVFKFSRVAATWERLRWDIHTKGASPGDRARLEELNAALQVLATELGLGTVDPDERLRITGIDSGTFDAKFKDVKGKTCLVRNIKVTAGEIFSIEERDLTSCDR